MALEWTYLLPVDRQHAVRQVRKQHLNGVVGSIRQVLDAVLNQCPQRGELVSSIPLARLEDRNDTLAEEKRITHGATPMSAPGGRTASPHYCEREGHRGQTRSGGRFSTHSDLRHLLT